jgi:D-alanyl-D-alanine dipeptidase
MPALPLLYLATLLLTGACHQASEQPAPASPSVNTAELPVETKAAAESLLVDVRSLDSTIQVDARYAGSNNFTGAPLPGYEAPRALLRREAAHALVRVQARLRTGDLGLLIFDGYRPVRATLAMVNWAEQTGRRDLLDQGYIARRSRHNLGLAVDLTLSTLRAGRFWTWALPSTRSPTRLTRRMRVDASCGIAKSWFERWSRRVSRTMRRNGGISATMCRTLGPLTR